MIVRIARRLTRSTLLGGIAGVLLICDGVSHVQSRMGMLDIFAAFFVLLAFGCLLLDRDQVRTRLAIAVREGWATESRVRPAAGRSLVAVRDRGVARPGLRLEVVGHLLRRGVRRC